MIFPPVVHISTDRETAVNARGNLKRQLRGKQVFTTEKVLDIPKADALLPGTSLWNSFHSPLQDLIDFKTIRLAFAGLHQAIRFLNVGSFDLTATELYQQAEISLALSSLLPKEIT